MSAPDSEAPVTMKVLTVTPDADGGRLDQWLASALAPGLSRNRVQTLIREGAVSIGGRTVNETRRRVAAGEEWVIAEPQPEPAAPEGEPIELSILYEDDQLVVVDKPAGLVVHPGPGNWTGTLVNALIHHCGDTLSGIGGVRRPGIVHRLDKETSGVMVVAKTDAAHRALSEAFADHGRSGDLERAYYALVWGVMPRVAGTIDAPLGRSAQNRTQRSVVPQGRADARHAVTRYSVLARYGSGADGLASLVECRLETGRTHQIRVHMAHVGHPLIGDQEYGRAFATKVRKLPEPLRTEAAGFARQALHARLLAFRHPSSDVLMRFEAPMPHDMQSLVDGFARLP